MIQQGSLVDGTCIVIQATGNGQVNGKILFRDTKSSQILSNSGQLLETLVKNLVAAQIAFQSREYFSVGATNGDELQNLVGLLVQQTAGIDQDGTNLVRSDLIQLVHGAHNIAALVGQRHHGVETIEDLPVIDPDLEPMQTETPEHPVDDGGDLRFVEDVQLAVTNDVDIRLVEFPETAALGTLTPVDLADLIAAEGEGQLVAVQSHILGQGYGQIKPQSQVAVALLETVDLLFRFTATLSQQDLCILNGGGIQGGKAVQRISVT